MLQWVVLAGMAAGTLVPLSGPPELQRGEIDPATPTIVAKLPGKMRAVTPNDNPGEWVTTRDYPPEAMRNLQQGTVRFRLVVDPEGRVSECQIIVSSGAPSLDATTCSLLRQRARFTPALDIKGKPATGTYSSAVRWVIPKKPAPPVAGTIERSLIVHADGSVTDCFEGRSEEIPPVITLKPMACPFAQATPVKDALGNPLTRRVIITNRTQVLPVD